MDLRVEHPVSFELAIPTEAQERMRLIELRTMLSEKFKEIPWYDAEIETISLELGLFLTPLLRDKIEVLKIIEAHPNLFYNDPAFMLYATEVINNEPVSFDMIPHCTTLELAFSISEVHQLLVARGITLDIPETFAKVVAYFLRQEGYSDPIGVFSFIPSEYLSPGQLPEDTEAKLKAINAYLYRMTNHRHDD